MTENIINFPTTLPTMQLTKAVAPPAPSLRNCEERLLMDTMEVGDSFACPDDASFWRAQRIAYAIHANPNRHGHRRYQTQAMPEIKAGKWVKDLRVWRVG